MYAFPAVAAAILGFASSAAATTCTETDGNYYCDNVESVSYSNFGGSGTYNRVTSMSDTTGACDFTSTSYSGSIAPFDEELSIHIQGPFYLKQFAFYTPSSSSSKRDIEDFPDLLPILEERATTTSPTCPGSNSSTYTTNGKSFVIECGFDRPGDIGMTYQSSFQACINNCAATANCIDVSYVSNGGGACYMKSSIATPAYNSAIYGGRLVSTTSSTSASTSSKASSTSTSSSSKASTTTSSKTTTATTLTTSVKSSSTSTTSSTIATSTKSSSTTTSSQSSTSSPAATGTSFARESYYSATSGTAQGVTFLNTMGGGTVSGVWSSYFGSSLSYASSDGSAAASSSTILANTTLADSTQIALFAGTTCASDNGCGYYREGTVAYHGFGGSSKIFLFEFSMPNDSGNNQPALWFLNALIPRTQQYGSCSCWANTAGCGELDIFEVLDSGDARMESSVHSAFAGGDSDYFTRPTTGTVKVAVVLSNNQAVIKMLDSSFSFGTTLSSSDYAGLIASTDSYVSGDVSTVSLT